MSAYSCGLEVSRKSDAILRADAMTQRSDGIIMGNPNIVHGFSYCIYNNATTILVNWQKNIIQHLTVFSTLKTVQNCINV